MKNNTLTTSGKIPPHKKYYVAIFTNVTKSINVIFLK